MKKFLLIGLLLLSLRCWAAVPVVEHYTSNVITPGTDLVLTKPDNVASGDLLLIIAGNDSWASPDFNEITDPLAWTRFVHEGDSIVDCTLACYWRIATGDEAITTTVTSASADLLGWYIRISGVDTTTPINAIGTVYTGHDTSHAITEVTSDVNDCLCIYALMFDGADGDPYSVSGTGWTETDEQQSGVGGTNTSGCWGTKEQATAGGAGTATVTSSVSDGASAIQFAVAPSAVTGPLIGAIMIVD